ncbi:MAG TPA: hypothetical protein VG537_09570 [Candidatus Kapabacteria bacterium]|jgi:hypothetical protein|nr:hypothetical protein [Candidatus Kapabacteria bacterium]
MFIIAAFILGFITMLLWNALIPDIFHGPVLTYWQSVGLLVLARVLVGIRGKWGWRRWHRWGPPWKWPKHHRRHWQTQCGPQDEWWWKFAKMSPEERQKAKEEWRARRHEWKGDKDKWKAEFSAHFGKPDEPNV